MAKSRNWSSASAPCRVELRRSPWLAAALALLGCLAAGAVLLSEMPFGAAVLLAAAALLHGARLATIELRRRPVGLVFSADGTARVDGAEATRLNLQWRGPLLFAAWRAGDGRTHRRLATPDILDRPARRELRLVAATRTPAPRPGSVAP